MIGLDRVASWVFRKTYSNKKFYETKMLADGLDLSLTCWFSRHGDRDQDGRHLMLSDLHHRTMAVYRAINSPAAAAWGGYETEEGIDNIVVGITGDYRVIKSERDLYQDCQLAMERRAARRRQEQEWHLRVEQPLSEILAKL